LNIPILSILIASATTFIVIFLLRPFAISINLVDNPNSRKPHTGSVPLIGGIAMFIGIAFSIIVSTYDLNQYDYFLLASSIIVIIGVLDDHRNISVSLRLFFQIIVAIIIVTVGDTSIESLGNLFGREEIFLNKWAYFVSVIAIISGMNAINMTDGIHGLAGGTSLVSLLAILYLSIDIISKEYLFIVFLLCSVLPVFLIHNLCLGLPERNRIFMGDAGSMFIGLVMAWLLINLSQGEERAFTPVTALWLFAVPLIDMISAILRRLVSGKSPFMPDLFHFHHLLIRLGAGEKTTLVVLVLFSGLMAVIGILGLLYEVAEWVMFVGFLSVVGAHIFLCNITLRKSKAIKIN
jgi:UDP-GlcNAc:undecaprenyl-phosphate/decaprenyl-phosphate GlcNAc-1-phosphate transferase